MASTVGRIEKKTQQRIVTLLCEQLRYDYPGDWTDCENIRNVEPDLLSLLLKNRAMTIPSSPVHPTRAIKLPRTRARSCMTETKRYMTCCATE